MNLSFVTILSGLLLVSSTPLKKENLRLIKTSEESAPEWLNESEIWNLIESRTHFIDLTDHHDLLVKTPPVRKIKALPTTCQHQNQTKAVLESINDERIQEFIKHFSSYHTRYYKSKTGVESQKWLFSQVQETLEGFPEANASVEEFEHNWPQKSVIARIEGADPELRNEVIVLGAHQDSVNLWGSSFRAPGADDNAAGSVVVLESLRAILESGHVPKRTIEFHWYAAEEVGLRGSAAVAQAYRDNEIDVIGMLNFDVPGYQGEDVNEIGIYTDHTHPELNGFLRIVAKEYLTMGWQDCKCGYGCSDHASWTNYGFPAAMPSEVKVNPHMHTSQDNIQKVSFPQLREFIKLALGTIVEYGETSHAL